MPSSTASSPPSPKAKAEKPPTQKVYRSMAEIRRAFYPKAAIDKTPHRERASNHVIGKSTRSGGSL